MSSSPGNGSWPKRLGPWLVVAIAFAATTGGYAVMKYQVGNHETRINVVEGDQSSIKERLKGIETLQSTQVTAMQNMLQEMRRIHTVPVSAP